MVAKFKNLKLGTTCESRCIQFVYLANIHPFRPCGSTVGPPLSQIGIRTVDVGAPMLSMHSIRETAGSLDVQPTIDLFRSLFEGFYELDKNMTVD